jgi:hypothetical protein
MCPPLTLEDARSEALTLGQSNPSPRACEGKSPSQARLCRGASYSGIGQRCAIVPGCRGHSSTQWLPLFEPSLFSGSLIVPK